MAAGAIISYVAMILTLQETYCLSSVKNELNYGE